MGADRVERLADRLRRTGAYYDNDCFEQFLWFPIPGDEWQLIIGEAKQYHAELWRQRARHQMADAWGVGVNVVPWSLEGGFIPTGYVDFTQVGIREVPYMVLPDPLPNGWTEGMVRRQLKCSEKLHRVKWEPERSADPTTVAQYIQMIERSLDPPHQAPV